MDYFLKTVSKELFIQDLSIVGYQIVLTYDYYQDENIIVDWIGIIPNPPVFDDDGNVIGETTYKDGLCVNIRSVLEIDINLFLNTVSVYPDIPYRVFS